MDRYQLFRTLMDIVADNYEVTAAEMRDILGSISIAGECGDKKIHIRVDLEEGKEDA